MATTDEQRMRDALRFHSECLAAILRGATGDAHAWLKLADEEIESVRVRHDTSPAIPRAPDEPDLPPAIQEQGAST